MTTETDQVNVDAEDDGTDRDFDAGFEGSEQTTTPAAPVEPAPAAADASTTAEPAPAPKLAQITEDQLAALMRKAEEVDQIRSESKRQIDTLAGHLGGMKQVVEGLKQRGVSAAQLKRFGAEYPEMAAMLAADLAEVGGGGQAVDPAEIARIAKAEVAQEVAQLRVQVEVDKISDKHEDWVAVVNNPGFQKWSQTLTPADQQRLAGTDGKFIAGKITEWKAGRDAYLAKIEADKKAAAAKTSKSNNRARQLEAAVPAKGVGGHAPAPAAEDDFEAGFRAG
jgi:hypothetical protein